MFFLLRSLARGPVNESTEVMSESSQERERNPDVPMSGQNFQAPGMLKLHSIFDFYFAFYFVGD